MTGLRAMLGLSVLLHGLLLAMPWQPEPTAPQVCELQTRLVLRARSAPAARQTLAPRQPEPAQQVSAPEPVKKVAVPKPVPVAEPARKPALKTKPKPKAAAKPLPPPAPLAPDPEPSVVEPEPAPTPPISTARTAETAVSGPAATPAPGKPSAPRAQVEAAGPVRDVEFGSSNGPCFARRAPPCYPRLALRRGEQGTVRLRLTINAAGVLTKVEVLQSAGRLLDKAALKSARASSYRPALQNGKPVDSTAILPIRFILENG